jgi:hypothetical protein
VRLIETCSHSVEQDNKACFLFFLPHHASHAFTTSTHMADAIFRFKVSCGEEKRRFALTRLDLGLLRATLSSLLPPRKSDTMVLWYVDDEGDEVGVHSDMELAEAARLMGQPLKLQVSCEDIAAAPEVSQLVRPAVPLAPPPGSANMVSDLAKQGTAIKQRIQELRLELSSQTKLLLQVREQHRSVAQASKAGQISHAQAIKEPRTSTTPSSISATSSATPFPTTAASPAASPSPLAPRKELARFVSHGSLPDGTTVGPGLLLIKTWRFRNESAQAWPQQVQLLALNGADAFAVPLSTPVARSLVPGGEMDVSVALRSPQRPGRYHAHFRLADGSGRKFGQRVWVQLTVASPSGTAEVASSSSSEDETAAVSSELSADHSALLSALSTLGFRQQRRNARLLRRYDGRVEDVLAHLQSRGRKHPHQ